MDSRSRDHRPIVSAGLSTRNWELGFDSPGEGEKEGRLQMSRVLDDHPIASMMSRAIMDGVIQLTGVSDRAAVRAPLDAFSRWVAMLPASQNNHHSHDFGLLQHSLKVAWLFLSRLGLPEQFCRVEQLPDKERRPWILAGMAAALLHDCGKLLDIEVSARPSGKVWDPMKEALTTFLRRNLVPPTREIGVKFMAGRGLKGHEARGRALIPIILPRSFADDLIRKTLAIYDACVSHHQIEDPRIHWPAAWFAAIILTADREDSAADLTRRKAN